MPTRPWIKFYPADWQADELLGMCTLAARGLWIEMIGIMHKADPYGHLVVNGRPPTDTQLAALARTSPDQIPSLLEELENAGVFSRTRTRVIYSRRMTRDERRRKDGETAKITGMKVPRSRRSQTLDISGNKLTTLKVVGKVAEQPPSPQRPEARGLEEEKASLSGGPKEAGRRRRQVPKDWLPDEAGRDYARSHAGWSESRIEREIEAFRNHHLSKATLFADISAGWRTWVQNGRRFDIERGRNDRRSPHDDIISAFDHISRPT